MGNKILDRDTPIVIGHRGNAMFAPENTLCSFEQAVAAGADAIELDVHLTADNRVVVVHDAELRGADGSTVSVAASTLAQLQELDAGATFSRDAGASFPYRGLGIRIPTLDEVLAALPEMSFVIELKTSRAQLPTLDVIRRAEAEQRTVVASFQPHAVDLLRAELFPTGASQRELSRLYLQSLLRALPPQVPFNAMFAPRKYLRMPLPAAPLIRASKLLQIPLHLWVENSPATALALWRAGVCGIITDDPGSMTSARAKYLAEKSGRNASGGSARDGITGAST